jgi:hypothetical protein
MGAVGLAQVRRPCEGITPRACGCQRGQVTYESSMLANMAQEPSLHTP